MNFAKVVNIAVFVAGLDEEYQSNIIGGINEFAKKNNINVSYFAAYGGMINSHQFDIGEYSIYELANLEKFDGAILMTNTINDKEIKDKIVEKIRKAKTASVIFDCDDYEDIYNISINNSNAMHDMVRHVISAHGAKVINYISGPMSNPEAVARLEAFREVMAEFDLPVDEDRIYYGEFRSGDGHAAIEEYMKSGKSLPDAFICANDAMAMTAMSTLEKYGFCVPLDVIVTGFDYTFSARNSCPALTTVKRPLAEMGKLACSTILDMISGRTPNKADLEASCVFTESCGCSGNAQDNLSEYRKATYNRIESSNNNIRKLNRLTANLAETETAEEHFDVIRAFVPNLDCSKFTFCLTSNWQDNADHNPVGYSVFDNMTAPFVWTPDGCESIEYFRGTDMFPTPQNSGGNINYFIPLHYRDKVQGYFIITNSDFPTSTLLCHTFSMNVSNSIENLRKISHINKAMAELNRIYVIDPLTNIYNRNGFIKITDDTFRTCAAEKRKVMISFIDMDGLKFINDNYGHNEGDFAIQRLAKVIEESCRPGDICARFGGDEFVLFAKDVTDDAAERLERCIEAKLNTMNAIINKPYKISASTGSYVTEVNESDTLYKIIKKADELMYEVKRHKKESRSCRPE